MSSGKEIQNTLRPPFVVGKDGRVYISEVLISTSTITKLKITGRAHAAS